MKNGAIVLQRAVSATEDGARAPLDALLLNGYDLEELRVLPLGEGERLRNLLSASAKAYDNTFILTEKGELPALLSALGGWLGAPSTTLGGAGIFDGGKYNVFLLATDEGESGAGFLKSHCLPYLQKKYNLSYGEIVLRAVGVSEARAEALVEEIRRKGKESFRVQRVRKYDEEVIKLTYDNGTPKMLVDDAVRALAEGLGDTMYALNDIPLEEQLVSVLKLRGKKISVAESFTGGGIAKRITSVSGASEVYFEGLNTYAEESKIKRLGVSKFGLHTAGAVSDQTAYEMALGLLQTGDCDISIATTGLAGPKSDRSLLPVGLCFIAVGTKEKIFVYRYKFDGNRKEITEKAINYALFLAYKQLKNQ